MSLSCGGVRFFLLIVFVMLTVAGRSSSLDSVAAADDRFERFIEDLYLDLNDTILDKQSLLYGMRGYFKMKELDLLENDTILTIIDMGQTSEKERMYVIDLYARSIRYRSLVAHGQKTGSLKATRFSNNHGSHQTSLGFYVTGYAFDDDRLEYCMKLKGLERYNNNAWMRGVIVHTAWYATPEFLEKNGGVLGRSYGCPAMPYDNYCEIIDLIDDGTCYYIYHPASWQRGWSWYGSSTAYRSWFGPGSHSEIGVGWLSSQE